MTKFFINAKIKLFLLSFLILFLELSLIRYIPANIRLAGYFSNLILMATFTGLGTGLLLAIKKNYILYLYPYLLLVLVLGLSFLGFSLTIGSSGKEVIFFDSFVKEHIHLEPWIVLPLIYIIVSLIFVPCGVLLRQSFAFFKPLTAYTIDILGSITGIVLFTILAFLASPAWIWFLIIALTSYFVLFFEEKNKYKYLHLAALIIVTGGVLFSNLDNIWSPYYKITITKLSDQMTMLSTNNIPHQFITDYKEKEPFYYVPYERFHNPIYKRVLIIGAGTGSDVAVTLGLNPSVERIDAVEIDPVILNYGKALNPNQPYSNPKVTLHVADGREFLQQTDQQYDLIIFALTDSLTLLGGSANLRLESFLFTKETFSLAKAHLSDNGLLILYNYYREPWLVKKLNLMLNETFGQTGVHVIEGNTRAHAASLLAGPKLKDLKNQNRLSAKTNTLPLAEDDWPFLYLKYKTLPGIYIAFIIGIVLITSVFVFLAMWYSETKSAFDYRLFFFGAGFLLLETKMLVTFSLLFGSTWVVNSLVFTAILVFVLLANLISNKFTFKRLYLLYTFLFILLGLNYLIPPSHFFNLDLGWRYLSASVFYFSPIMVANIIFSQLFKKTTDSGISFGSNLLGGVFGAIVEYTSLITGYKALIIFIMLFYSLSLIRFNKFKLI